MIAGNNSNRGNQELFSSKEFSPKEFVRRIFTETLPNPTRDSNSMLVISNSQNWERSVGNIHNNPNNFELNALENMSIHGSFSSSQGIQITNTTENKQEKNTIPEDKKIISNPNEHEYIPYEELIFDEDVRTHKLSLDEYYSQVQTSTLNHIYNIKIRLLKKHEMEISAINSQHKEQLEMNDSKIQMLTDQLNQCQLINSQKITHLEAACLKICMSYGKKCGMLVSTKFLLKIIHSWKRYSLENKRLRQLGKLTIKMIQKSKQRKFFTIWTKVQVQYYIYEIRKEAKSRLDITTKSIVEKYEQELKRVKSELSEAHAAVRQEQLRRHQIEEDLRRMFLKNMTVMNMEALTLFQPPQAQPQSPQYVASAAITTTASSSSTNPIIMDNTPHRRSKPTAAPSSQVKIKAKSVPAVVATASASAASAQSRGPPLPPPPHSSLGRSVQTTSKTAIDSQLRQQQEQRFQQLQRQQEQQQLKEDKQLELFQQQQRMIKLRSQTQSNRQILIDQQQQHQQQQQQGRGHAQLSHFSCDHNQDQLEDSLLSNKPYGPSPSSSAYYFKGGVDEASSSSPPRTTAPAASSSIFNLTSPGSKVNRSLSHDSEEGEQREEEEEEVEDDHDEEFPRELPPPLHLYTQQGSLHS